MRRVLRKGRGIDQRIGQDGVPCAFQWTVRASALHRVERVRALERLVTAGVEIIRELANLRFQAVETRDLAVLNTRDQLVAVGITLVIGFGDYREDSCLVLGRSLLLQVRVLQWLGDTVHQLVHLRDIAFVDERLAGIGRQVFVEMGFERLVDIRTPGRH